MSVPANYESTYGNVGRTVINNLVINGTIHTPYKVRSLFSPAAATNNILTYDNITGVLSVNTGSSATSACSGNDARLSTPNVKFVKKTVAGAGEYTSVAAAIASITNATISNCWLVEVGPGTFLEPTFTVPSGVYVHGKGMLETKIVCWDASKITVKLSDASQVSNLAIMGPPTQNGSTVPGSIGVLYESIGNRFPTVLDGCLLANSETLVKVVTTVPTSAQIAALTTTGSLPPSPDTLFALRGCSCGPLVGATTGIEVISTPGTTTSVYMNSILAYDTPPHANRFVKATGTGSLVVLTDVVLSLVGSVITLGTAAIEILDGAEARIYSTTLKGYDIGVLVPAGTGATAAPILRVYGLVCQDCNSDMSIAHHNTVGICTSYVNQRKTFIHKDCFFYIINRDINIVNVSPRSGDYNTLESAIASINPVVTASVTADGNGDLKVLTAATPVFNVSMCGVMVTGTGIPANTLAHYINGTQIAIDNAVNVLAGSTITVTFVRATATNAFSVSLGSGSYTCTAVSIPNYVSLYTNDNEVHVTLSGPITLGRNCVLRRINFVAATLGYSALIIDGSIDIQIIECTFKGFSTGCTFTSQKGPSDANFEVTYFMKCLTGVLINGSADSENTSAITCQLTDVHFDGTATNTMDYAVYSVGENAFVGLSLCTVNNALTGTGIFCANAGTLRMISCEVSRCNNGLVVGAAGLVGPIIKIGNSGFGGVTKDVNILHPNARGIMFGTFQRSKTYINPVSTVSMTYLDPIASGIVVIGPVCMGDNNADATDVSPLIRKSIALGVHTGGYITLTSGTSVSVSSGIGYLTNNGILSKVTWVTTILVLPADRQNYIYITKDTNGSVVTFSIIKPIGTATIYLGRVVTSVSSVAFLERTPINSQGMTNRHEEIARETIGSIFPPGGGCLVSASFVPAGGSNPATIQLNITSGRYYYGETQFNPSGATPATMTTYAHVAGTWAPIQVVTSVDYSQYDNGTDLTPIPSGNYVHHSLYLIGDGDAQQYLMVYGSTYYNSIALSRASGTPAPPPYFNDAVVLIASMIVQQGNELFCEVNSHRPTYSFVSSSVSGNISSHSELLNLNRDDHPQYLKVDGTRAMTGALNMASNNITNTGTVNGVTVETHASRHLINGADPLQTAMPVALLAGNINALGGGPGFARSDHIHQLNMAIAGTTLIADQAAAATVGISDTLAYGDHTHIVPTATAVSIGSANARGVSMTTFSRADHVHQGIHSITANSGGVARFGDLTFLPSTLFSITDNGNGTFTMNAARVPQQLHYRFGTGAYGDSNIGILIPGSAPTIWSTTSSFIYRGSTANIGSPAMFSLAYSLPTADTTFEARLYDVTNNNTLATISGITGPVIQSIASTNTFSTVPTGTSLIEVQVRRSVGADTAITIYAMYFEY